MNDVWTSGRSSCERATVVNISYWGGPKEQIGWGFKMDEIGCWYSSKTADWWDRAAHPSLPIDSLDSDTIRLTLTSPLSHFDRFPVHVKFACRILFCAKAAATAAACDLGPLSPPFLRSGCCARSEYFSIAYVCFLCAALLGHMLCALLKQTARADDFDLNSQWFIVYRVLTNSNFETKNITCSPLFPVRIVSIIYLRV